MPGRRTIHIDDTLCRRCQVDTPVITIRTEPLCGPCFCRYVSAKVVKRMESFRVRHSDPGKERLLLLPLSYGYSSQSLLYTLDQHLKGQIQKTGRTGFQLHVLHVDDGTLSSSEREAELTKSRFPGHAYSTIQLDTITDAPSIDDISKLLGNSDSDDGASAEVLLKRLGSATSRADVLQILRRQSIVHFALRNDCEAILWGDSTTRLAERTLAETAKGRGFSVPYLVADGESPYNIPFYFPMRDLLSKEIVGYASLVEPSLEDLVVRSDVKQAVSTKNTTIDELVRQYFEQVEREHPSIVANVVKTAGKLQLGPMSAVETQCELCNMPLVGQAPERSRLCYGCIRTLQAR